MEMALYWIPRQSVLGHHLQSWLSVTTREYRRTETYIAFSLWFWASAFINWPVGFFTLGDSAEASTNLNQERLQLFVYWTRLGRGLISLNLASRYKSYKGMGLSLNKWLNIQTALVPRTATMGPGSASIILILLFLMSIPIMQFPSTERLAYKDFEKPYYFTESVHNNLWIHKLWNSMQEAVTRNECTGCHVRIHTDVSVHNGKT